MESNVNQNAKWKQVLVIAALVAAIVLVAVKMETSKSVLADNAQLTFESPLAAGAALNNAAKAGDEEALSQILGIKTRTLLTTGDKEADKAATEGFASKYDEMNRWVAMTDGSQMLYIGADNFAFPVPLAKDSSGRWYFDAVGGEQEIRARNIGRNELLAIDTCAAIANAQDMFFATVGTSAEFAQRIVSTAGKQDGLYWPVSDAQAPSPLGSFSQLPKSSLASYPPQEPLVVDGYSFRILTAQGNAAPGGARSYIVNGKMTRGFAILATPVRYAETGIMTFMTGSDGIVYEQDFGPDTAKIASSIREFNPSDDWLPVE
ncbi:MAG TPA: DUF2950 family protein [Candidatus Aquilonibacter sp.]|nr:DUF2950 family protein [Candidatus Aquilonibacter sp.]